MPQLKNKAAHFAMRGFFVAKDFIANNVNDVA